jgi:uncharacterized protein YkwD
MNLALFFISFLVLFPFNLSFLDDQSSRVEKKQVLAATKEDVMKTPTPTSTLTPTPTNHPTATPTVTPVPTVSEIKMERKSNDDAKRIEYHNGSINITIEGSKTKALEILQALNAYRSTHGVRMLFWDQKLADLAQFRAEQFAREQRLDNHAGFKILISDPNKIREMGFVGLGENSSYGYSVSGMELITKIYAGDLPHDNNQLNPDWTHVGIGVKETATDIVFGKK